jgi:hypothetical protein
MVDTRGEQNNISQLADNSAGSSEPANPANLPLAIHSPANQPLSSFDPHSKAPDSQNNRGKGDSVQVVSDSGVASAIRKILVLITEHPVLSGALGAILAALVLAVPGSVQNWIRPGPPPKLAAEINNVRITDPRMSLGDFMIDYFDLPADAARHSDQLRTFLAERGLPTAVADADLQTLGSVIAFDATFYGLAGRPCLVEWTIYDADSQQPVPDGYLRDQPAFPHGRLIPEAQEDRASERIWVPRPPRSGEFFVRLEIFEDTQVISRVPLAQVDSDSFK